MIPKIISWFRWVQYEHRFITLISICHKKAQSCAENIEESSNAEPYPAVNQRVSFMVCRFSAVMMQAGTGCTGGRFGEEKGREEGMGSGKKEVKKWEVWRKERDESVKKRSELGREKGGGRESVEEPVLRHSPVCCHGAGSVGAAQ